MQQTETYKLNKPESTDTFSVGPLNENADTLEAQLARLDGADAALEARADGLEGRVTALEVQKIFFGTFIGNGGVQTIDLGFTPLAVLLVSRSPIDPLLAIGDQFAYHAYEPSWLLKIVENGFRVQVEQNFNEKNRPFNYIAFA